jgi:phytoene desaturase
MLSPAPLPAGNTTSANVPVLEASRRAVREVAVIGGGLGGMAAAGELARAGHRVTLFEGSDQLGGKARALRVDGLTLDTGPTLLTMPEGVRDAFRRLDAEDLLPRFVELDEQCRYSFSGGEAFGAFRDVERTARAVASHLPDEAGGVLRFYEEAAAIWRAAGEPYLEAPYVGLPGLLGRVAKRGVSAMATGLRLGTLRQLAERHFRSEHLRQFVGRFATYVGASPYAASAAFALIPHVERAFGVHHPVGGMGALSQAMEQALQRLGVRVVLEAKASWKEHRGALVAGPAGGEDTFDALVVNADPLSDRGTIEGPLSLSGYVLLLEADRRLSLPHHSVFFSGDDRGEFDALFKGHVPDDNTVYVCHPAASDPTMAPDGRSGLFVMVNVPALADGGTEPSAALLRERTLSTLRRRSPELRDVKLRVLGERTPGDLQALGAPRGSIYGFLPHGRFGPFRRPQLRGAAPGVFYAGGGTHPGGGVPLVLLSGHYAAQLVQSHLEHVT